MPADPLMSEGARAERQALRNYLRRKRDSSATRHMVDIDDVLRWVDKRRARYDAAPGGLGRK